MTTSNKSNRYKKSELWATWITTLSVIIMGGINIYVTETQNNERLIFDKQNSQSIFSLQNRDLFIKDSEQDLTLKKSEIDFLKMGFEECNKDDESSFNRISAYAEALFSSAQKRQDMVNKVRKNCPSKGNSQTASNRDEQTHNAEYYRKSGVDYLKGKRYADAAQSFISATQLSPDDASLWNQRAYAQFRAGSYNEAKDSISVAIKTGSHDDKTNKYMAINAAKILCAQGQLNDGGNYIRQAINVLPGLYPVVKKDSELINICYLNFME